MILNLVSKTGQVMENESTYIRCTIYLTKIDMNSCHLLCTYHLINSWT